MNFIEVLTTYEIWGMELKAILIFFAIIFATLVAAKAFNIILLKFIKTQTSKTATELDDNIISAIEKPIDYFIYTCGFYFSILSLNPSNDPVPIKSIVEGGVETVAALLITWLCFRVVDVFDDYVVNHYGQQTKNKDALFLQFFPLFKRAIKVAIAFIAVIIIVQNRGYSVTSLLTGFGITGLAVGFAAKESISNIFGSFTLVVDHAFKVGDWIVVDKTINGSNAEGIVEDITLRSTKIRAFDNTLLMIPNNEMAMATIRNVSLHKKRRIYEYVDITYNTPPEKIEQAVEICRQIVRNHPGMQDYQQIHLNQMGSHSLRIMLYIFTHTTDWGEYLVIRQEIFLSIIREFNKLGVEFAFPTQTLYLAQDEANIAKMPEGSEFNK